MGELKVFDRTSLTDEAEIIEHIGDAEVVITNKTPISRQVLDACPSIRFISVLATGYNVIDIAYIRVFLFRKRLGSIVTANTFTIGFGSLFDPRQNVGNLA